MQVIAMGYSGTGSSAIVQLLDEYDNCSNAGLNKYEHLPFYTPHGLFDLEDRLLLNNSLYQSDAAINDFECAMYRLNDNDFGWFGGYQRRFENKFIDNVNEFIRDITTYTRKGYWSNDFQYKKCFNAYIKDCIKKIFNHPINKFGYSLSVYGDNKVNYAFIDDNHFYTAAKIFIKKYMKMLEPDEDKTLVLDQILLPHNLYRIPRYFDQDVRCIVLDRDPRDMYILSKYIWTRNGSYALFPESPEKFAEFYCKLISMEKQIEDSRILRIHFEDMIYYYDETIDKIEKFIGKGQLGIHIKKWEFFNPNISINNTQNFRIKPAWEKEVDIIAKKMKNYLYDFPYEFYPQIENTCDP